MTRIDNLVDNDHTYWITWVIMMIHIDNLGDNDKTY